MKKLGHIVLVLAAIGLLLTFMFAIASKDAPMEPIPTAPVEVHTSNDSEADAAVWSERIDEDLLLPALEEICDKRNQGTIEEAVTKSNEDRIKERDELFQTITNRLSASDFLEHLHLAALIEKDPAMLVDLVDRTATTDGANSMLVWDSLHYCSQANVSGDCPLRELEERILSVDGQNSETLIRIAANRYANGEMDEALRLLRRASTSATTNDYWTQRILLIERG